MNPGEKSVSSVIKCAGLGVNMDVMAGWGVSCVGWVGDMSQVV